MSLPMYSRLTGMAERMIRSTAFKMVSGGLVCHTSLKNRGRLFSAEKRSFRLRSFMVEGGGMSL